MKRFQSSGIRCPRPWRWICQRSVLRATPSRRAARETLPPVSRRMLARSRSGVVSIPVVGATPASSPARGRRPHPIGPSRSPRVPSRRRARRPRRGGARARARCGARARCPATRGARSTSSELGLRSARGATRSRATGAGSSRAQQVGDVAGPRRGAAAARSRRRAGGSRDRRGSGRRARPRGGRGASRRRRARRARACALPPRRSKRAVLERAQELRLQRERELADLVEEERAAARELEAADARRDRAGERAALVAEELALDERLRERRAVDVHERPLGARRGRVELARREPLAGARLAEQQHGALGGRDAREPRCARTRSPPSHRRGGSARGTRACRRPRAPQEQSACRRRNALARGARTSFARRWWRLAASADQLSGVRRLRTPPTRAALKRIQDGV